MQQRLRTIDDFADVRDDISVFTLNSYGNRLLKRKYAGFRQLGMDKKARHFVLANYLRPVVDKCPVIAANINNKTWVNLLHLRTPHCAVAVVGDGAWREARRRGGDETHGRDLRA